MTNGDSEKLDVLIDQVGRMTEGITELRIVVTEGFSELKEGFSELKEGFSELKEVAQQQGENIRLLIEQGAQRQEENQQQQRNVERLLTIVETLIQRQNQQ